MLRSTDTFTDGKPDVLVVDDDRRLRDLLQRYLSGQGFRVTLARDAADARAKLAGLSFDLIILDVMMPGESGLDLTSSLRADSDMPILLLTARGDPADRIEGLRSGADDYLAKPFEPEELLLRMQAILRRGRSEAPDLPVQSPADTVLHLGGCVFDLERQVLERSGELVPLTSAEAALLSALAARPGEAISREDLAEGHGGNAGSSARSVDVHVTRIRRKIETNPRYPRYLQTVRGKGYVLRPD